MIDFNLIISLSSRPDFKFHSPSVVILRRSDILKPYVVYNGEMEVDNVKEFVLKASIPSMVRQGKIVLKVSIPSMIRNHIQQ